MTRIEKEGPIPDILLKKGAKERARMELLFRQGVRNFDFRKYYSHPTVKAALILCQHDKCCFCEEKITHIAFGHVEHYRPKGGIRQHEEEEASPFGYFWLAYDWTNLFLCCEICNSVFKQTYFPLENPSQRMLDPQGDLAVEDPLILNPSVDPSNHLEFRKWSIKEKENSLKGKHTIARTGLDRLKLVQARSEHFRHILGLANAFLALRAEAEDLPESLKSQAEILALIKEAMLPTARFSAMVRDNFAHLLQ